MPPAAAVIDVTPSEIAVTNPLSETVATDLFEDVQVTVLSVAFVGTIDTCSCVVSPIIISDVGWLMVTAVTSTAFGSFLHPSKTNTILKRIHKNLFMTLTIKHSTMLQSETIQKKCGAIRLSERRLSQSQAQINNTPHPYDEVQNAHRTIQGDEWLLILVLNETCEISVQG